jgi:hypothetical protein
VQKEIAHYLHKWNLICQNSHLRVLAMCRIYVTLRDGAAAKWLTPEIESEKLGILYKDMLELKNGGGTVNGEGVSLFLCPKCDTTLHGKDGCPWGSKGQAKAKQSGKQALGNFLASGGAVIPAPG